MSSRENKCMAFLSRHLGKWVLLVSLFFFVPVSIASASCFTASGFGDTSSNGTYVPFGTNDGDTAYTNGVQYLYEADNGSTFYELINVYFPPNTPTDITNQYYSSLGGSPVSPVNITGLSWTNGNGPLPTGSFSLATCPSTTTPTTALETEFTQVGWGTFLLLGAYLFVMFILLSARDWLF